MKRYLMLAAACAFAVAGCGRNAKSSGNAESAHVPGQETAVHDHSGHDHSGHDHAAHSGHTQDHSRHDHEAHSHAPGESCSGGHGQDHSGHNHGQAPAAVKSAAAVAAPAADHDGADEIIFPLAQARLAGLEWEEVVPRTFSEVIKAAGRILPAPGDEVTLVAPVGGIVSFASRNLSEGTSVGASQTLFHVSSRNVGGGDVAIKAAAAYAKAKADYERAEKLLADRIVSQREYGEAKYAWEQARAEYEAIAQVQSEKGTGVKTPIRGFVSSVLVSQGDYVEVGQTLATVSQNRRLTLRAEVSLKYYDRLPNVRTANFIVPYDSRTYSLAELGGTLTSPGRSPSEGSSLVPVSFQFDNNGAVVPGSYVEVYLIGSPEAGVITVPVEAISEQQGQYYVYVRLDEEGYQRRQVRKGPSDGRRVKILSGLRAGEVVVSRGAVNVKMASASAAIPHSHEH